MTPEQFLLLMTVLAPMAAGCFLAALCALAVTVRMLRFLRELMGETDAPQPEMTEADRFRHLGSH